MTPISALAAFAERTQPLPVLYSFRRCPYAMRARLAIATSGVRCELREVVLRNKPADLLAASPKATVPVLVLPGGQVIEQSLDIMHWALTQHDPHNWLASDGDTLNAMRALIADNDGEFKQHLDRYKYPNRYRHEHAGDEQFFAQSNRLNAERWLMTLQSRLSVFGCHAWLFGEAPSLADMAILPFVRQFAHTDPAWFDARPWPHLKAWLLDWQTGPLFQQVMEKYPPWQPGETGIAFGLVAEQKLYS
ncbi:MULTISPECIES: glutathione S-transferase [unclassified Polaromonas]|uniref:glutathione S-transferase n=1 Tax=unclassified Polaromonas TaxID=2638319 RepID=UPI0018C9ECAC|nr:MULTISPECIES: glutathione S-transferase [unclassified Polaromonas]MBG6073183.1 glutathione S-transferase [Polaromonas sp. CG_9.7]MBG6115187.1 glutathione S-transferase [Polaromonas sp. CG_9.2]MDH6185016.1 glutathione S-transferase [Polaromonas sp. CG_23.6]